MNFNKLLYVYFISIILFGCNSNEQHNNNGSLKKQEANSCNCEIIVISALYYNYLFNNTRARNWNDLKLDLPDFKNEYKGILDATITDCGVLMVIEDELKTLNPPKEQIGGADIRIIFTVSYKNSIDTTLCIGGYYGDGIFSKERIELESKNTNKLLYLIKNNIGYYSWFDEEDLNYMPELQDTTFVREPFIESPYYKKYKASPLY